MALLLAISIVQVIRTNPGSIPEDKEWDMQSDSMAEEASDEAESALSGTDDREAGERPSRARHVE